MTINPLPDQKADLNAAGPLSTDLVGAATPTRPQATRSATRSGPSTIATRPGSCTSSPTIHRSRQRLGIRSLRGALCDEFTDNHNWPQLLYIREARRMVSDTVLTQADLIDRRTKTDSIGLGSYRLDAHPTRLLAGADSTLSHEGTISAPIRGRYDIPYSILVPPKVRDRQPPRSGHGLGQPCGVRLHPDGAAST